MNSRLAWWPIIHNIIFWIIMILKEKEKEKVLFIWCTISIDRFHKICCVHLIKTVSKLLLFLFVQKKGRRKTKNKEGKSIWTRGQWHLNPDRSRAGWTWDCPINWAGSLQSFLGYQLPSSLNAIIFRFTLMNAVNCPWLSCILWPLPNT